MKTLEKKKSVKPNQTVFTDVLGLGKIVTALTLADPLFLLAVGVTLIVILS